MMRLFPLKRSPAPHHVSEKQYEKLLSMGWTEDIILSVSYENLQEWIRDECYAAYNIWIVENGSYQALGMISALPDDISKEIIEKYLDRFPANVDVHLLLKAPNDVTNAEHSVIIRADHAYRQELWMQRFPIEALISTRGSDG